MQIKIDFRINWIVSVSLDVNPSYSKNFLILSEGEGQTSQIYQAWPEYDDRPSAYNLARGSVWLGLEQIIKSSSLSHANSVSAFIIQKRNPDIGW